MNLRARILSIITKPRLELTPHRDVRTSGQLYMAAVLEERVELARQHLQSESRIVRVRLDPYWIPAYLREGPSSAMLRKQAD